MGLIANSILVNIDRISELLGRPEEITQKEAERDKMIESKIHHNQKLLPVISKHQLGG